MDDFELELKGDFIQEALLNLEDAEESFMELESSRDPSPLLDKIFRLAHNLKGGSRAVGFGQVAEFTHELENLVLKLKNKELGLSSEIVTVLLRSNDRLAEMMASLRDDMAASFDNSDLIEALTSCSGAENAHSAPEATMFATPIKDTSDDLTGDWTESLDEPLPPSAAEFEALGESEKSTASTLSPASAPIAAPTPAPIPVKSSGNDDAPDSKSGGEKREKKDDEVVRVDVAKIDSLNDLAGELIVLQSMIQQQSQLDGVTAKLAQSIQQMTKLVKDIQGLSMGMRMLPIKPLVRKLTRTVRDTASAVNKAVRFEIEGEQIEVDKSVLDNLGDPLIHILRNAVDHGLEELEDRLNGPKEAEGLVKLSFSNEGNFLVVQVKDDGKGIDPVVIRSKAIEKGLIKEHENLSEKQILNLIFHPGFSTKAQTSEISGRGVGMDVVKTNIEKMGGNADIESEVGKGSTFTIKIPLSLAVIEGIVIRDGQSKFVLPLGQIQETLNLKTLNVHSSKAGVGRCFELRGQVVPLYSLSELMNYKTPEDDESIALLINIHERWVALAVSDVLRSQQIVIKPLGNGIAVQKGWIGSCVLGDGVPTLILSPVDLLEGKVQYAYAESLAVKEGEVAA